MFCAMARSVLMHFKQHEKYQFSYINHGVLLIIFIIRLMLGNLRQTWILDSTQ